MGIDSSEEMNEEPTRVSPEPRRMSPELRRTSPEPRKTSPEPRRMSPESHRFSRKRERSLSPGEVDKEERHRSRSRRERHSRDRRGRSESEDNHSPERLPPSRTIVVRGLSRDVIKKEEIMRELDYYCVSPKDIRIIRRKTTGSSRGFAFVEFCTVREATRWMEKSKGIFVQSDGRRAFLEYSKEKDPSTEKRHRDWICRKCDCNNFRARVICFQCQAPIEESERNGSGQFRISSHPTKTILLQGLDVLSTEDSVLQAIQSLSSHAIRSIRLEKDKLTNTSLGICYIEMHTVSDAMELFRIMMENSLTIDEKEANVEFCNPLQLMPEKKKSEVASCALAAAQWSHQSASTSATAPYTQEEIESLAQYSASLYAKTTEEQQAYLQYYRQYFANQGSDVQGQTVSRPPSAAVTAAPTTAAVTAAPGTTQASAPQQSANSDYTYVENLGLYYSSSTGYYYNPQSQQFLHWDAAKQSYEPVNATESVVGASEKEGSGSKKKEPQETDKQKTAKKITREMERWAKSLKQKKEPSRASVPAAPVEVQPLARESKSADAGYAVLERRVYQMRPEELMRMQDRSESAIASSLVAAYGGDSDSDDGEKPDNMVDWTKLACLLCRRQFPSKAVLIKHQEQSALHLSNLEAYKKGKKDMTKLHNSKSRVNAT